MNSRSARECPKIMNVLDSPAKTYPFWLLLVSAGILVAERLFAWRKQQPFLRPQLRQDVFWLLFNGWVSAYTFGVLFIGIESGLSNGYRAITGSASTSIRFIGSQPLAIQIPVYLIVGDFVEYLVHNLLHRVPILWRIHRVHHSITTMDWIGNFRFHWGETIIYKTFKYLPLALLGADWRVILSTAVIATTIGHLNHANLNISWGPLRYILNSPRMHIWHHEKDVRGRAGVNFAVVFSFWDWIFGTAYMPKKHPQAPVMIGFHGQERVPQSLAMRFFLPFVDRKKEEKALQPM